jgi:hypothetical protein
VFSPNHVHSFFSISFLSHAHSETTPSLQRYKLNNLKANFETGFSLDRFKGWVTRRFQAMGKLDSQLVQPHLVRSRNPRRRRIGRRPATPTAAASSSSVDLALAGLVLFLAPPPSFALLLRGVARYKLHLLKAKACKTGFSLLDRFKG